VRQLIIPLMLASEYRGIDLLYSILDLHIACDISSEEFATISTPKKEGDEIDYCAIKDR